MGTRKFDFDYFVIGGGSGGVRSARIAAGHGARVGIAEERHWGGTCVNLGCVPKKLLAMAARYSPKLADALAFGWEFPALAHDWPTLIARKDVEIARLNGIYKSLLGNAGCELVEGRATFIDAHRISVGNRVVTAERMLIATGGRPIMPEMAAGLPGAFTSDEAFHLEHLPRRVVIVGAGYIAVEFAGIFHGLGSAVTVVWRGAPVLGGFDADLRARLGNAMSASGVAMRLGREIRKLEASGGGVLAALDSGEKIEADGVMFAFGRTPHTKGLGLELAGVAVDEEGAVVVDEGYATKAANVYAIGDVTNRVNLTPIAIAEGHVLADRLFGGAQRTLSYDNIPTAVFSDPPLSTAGLSEADAGARYGHVEVHRTWYRPPGGIPFDDGRRTFVKLVVNPEDDRVLGCHMFGVDAPELLQGIAIAMNCGLTKSQFDASLNADPAADADFWR